MKILKAVMLSLLVTICAIAGTVTVMHFAGFDLGGKDADIGSSQQGDDVLLDTDDNDYLNYDNFYDIKEAYNSRIMQRAAIKSEDTGYYYYYPIIFRDNLPGEKVVLSVSAKDFIGWEVDTNFANVELFDEITDGENVSVSFIMPENEPSIAALYTEIPSINMENTRNMLLNMQSMQEQGSTVSALSNTITPERGEPILMPPAEVNSLYSVTMNNPIEVEPGMITEWVIELSAPVADALNWLTFEYGTNGGWLRGTPAERVEVPTIPGGPYVFSIRIFEIYSAADRGKPENRKLPQLGIYDFDISILASNPDPMFRTRDVPDAMVERDYYIPLETDFFPSGSQWVITTTTIATPPGLKVDFDPLDNSVWWISGRPTEEALTIDGDERTYNFSFSIQQTRAGFTAWVINSPSYSITVWNQPTITPFNAPADLFDGIANINGVNKDYNVKLEGTGPDNSPKASPGPPPRPATEWTWTIRDIQGERLPPGLKLENRENDSVYILGFAEEPGNFTFTVRYTPNPRVLQGWVEEKYTITILSPPDFITKRDELTDGMDTLYRRYGVDEPDDIPYFFMIEANGFPASAPVIEGSPVNPKTIDWKWDWAAVIDSTLPVGRPVLDAQSNPIPIFRPGVGNQTAIINFFPESATTKTHTFNVIMEADTTNPNIKGAKVSRTFDLIIWQRRYLYIDFRNPLDRFVRRANVIVDPNDPSKDIIDAGANWNTPGWDSTLVADKFNTKRAVMPGTKGEIRVPLSNTGFVRWELSDVPLDALDNEKPNANSFARIGGPAVLRGESGYKAELGSAYAYLVIDMPSLDSTGKPVNDGDVYVSAFAADRPSWNEVLNPGTLYDITSGGFVSFASPVGGGSRPITWDLVSAADTFPPGMIYIGAGSVCTIMSNPTGPTKEGIYIFTLGINLPGSMRVERQFNFIVNPVPGVLLGDVDGNKVLDLRDLILLAKFVNSGGAIELPNPDAGNIETPKGSTPSGADLNILLRYFARPEVNLPTPAPATPDPAP